MIIGDRLKALMEKIRPALRIREFVVRSRSKGERTLRILPADFTTPIDYEVVACAPQISANEAPAAIVVRRKS